MWLWWAEDTARSKQVECCGFVYQEASESISRFHWILQEPLICKCSSSSRRSNKEGCRDQTLCVGILNSVMMLSRNYYSTTFCGCSCLLHCYTSAGVYLSCFPIALKRGGAHQKGGVDAYYFIQQWFGSAYCPCPGSVKLGASEDER